MANEITKIDESNAVSWVGEVIADSSGSWSRNSQRFATKAEAEASVNALMMRWFAVHDSRVMPTADAVNYRWDADAHRDVPVETPPREPKTATEAFLDGLAPALSRTGVDAASPKDVTARIRLEIKAAQTAGVIPAGVKFSITCTDYKSIRVKVTAWPGQCLNPEYITYVMEEIVAKQKDPSIKGLSYAFDVRSAPDRKHPYLTKEAADVLALVETLAGRHNYDHSDYMSDYVNVGYYLSVSAGGLQASAERGIRLELDPAFAEMVRKAHEASKRVGKKVTASVCPHGVDEASEWQLEHLLKLDAYAKGRPLHYDKRRGGWKVSEEVSSSTDHRSAARSYSTPSWIAGSASAGRAS